MGKSIFNYISDFTGYAKHFGIRYAVKKSTVKLNHMFRIRQMNLTWKSGGENCPSSLKKTDLVSYRCNICGKYCKTIVDGLKRDEPSCWNCGSTVRSRAIIHILSTELFGESLIIDHFPVRYDITGIGLSDSSEYALRLSEKLSYKNTYFHREPHMDITSIDHNLEGTLDFVISSDVFEHINPPVSLAFRNVRKLLKPNGMLILTAPYTFEKDTIEHFPDLFKYEITKKENNFILKNVTTDGREQIYHDLIFHGGTGVTLEMRVFSESSLRNELSNAGFRKIKFYRETDLDHGIYWLYNWSLPIAARNE